MRIDSGIFRAMAGMGVYLTPFFVLICQGGELPANRPVLKVRSQVFNIHYAVNDEAIPLAAVTLWYTLDQGKSWRNYGRDEDAQSPIQFQAPEEGLYGFYFVITNHGGSSGPLPDGKTAPHSWAQVDFTPPMVQLIEARLTDENSPSPTVSIRWTAIDTQLPARPVELAYRSVPAGEWVTIARDVANTGRYDWRITDAPLGPLVIRISVADEGGNLSTAESEPIETSRSSSADMESLQSKSDTANGQTFAKAPDERTRRLLERAEEHMGRGEYRLATARFRDVLKIDERQPDALMGLGRAYLKLEKLDDSADSFKSLLDTQPDHVFAQQGLAQVMLAQKDYDSARKTLSGLVRQQPRHVEGWLELGDLARLQGDPLSAVDYYEKAATLDPQAAQIISVAQSRLNEMRAK